MSKKIIEKEILLSSLSYEWLKVKSNSFKMSTYQKYKCVIEKYILTSFISLKPLTNITSADIAAFSQGLLAKGLSSKTVNDILIVLNSLMKYAATIYSIETTPIQYVKEQKKEMRVLTVSEQRNFEQYLKNDMDNFKFGVLFALYTGVRIGELCALQWKDISNGFVKIEKTMHRLKDEDGKTAVIIDTPKTENSYRTVPLPEFLNIYVEQRRDNSDKYVLSTDKYIIVEPRLMQIRFKKMTDDCGLNDVTFHTLRHTFATRCVECGFDIKTLSEILGHSDVKTTLNKYVHSSMELKKENMNKLCKIAV